MYERKKDKLFSLYGKSVSKIINKVIRKDLDCEICMSDEYLGTKVYILAIELQDYAYIIENHEEGENILQMVTNELRDEYDSYYMYNQFKVTFKWFLDGKMHIKEFTAD